jgi:hypothetical protein
MYRDGEELPEMVNAMFAMHSYDNLREQQAGKKDIDI